MIFGTSRIKYKQCLVNHLCECIISSTNSDVFFSKLIITNALLTSEVAAVASSFSFPDHRQWVSLVFPQMFLLFWQWHQNPFLHTVSASKIKSHNNNCVEQMKSLITVICIRYLSFMSICLFHLHKNEFDLQGTDILVLAAQNKNFNYHRFVIEWKPLHGPQSTGGTVDVLEDDKCLSSGFQWFSSDNV